VAEAPSRGCIAAATARQELLALFLQHPRIALSHALGIGHCCLLSLLMLPLAGQAEALGRG
jgi:hypothetical protein